MQNYHRHTSYSNLYASFKDSHVGYEDYAKRAVELKQQVLTSVEHGFQGNWLRCWQTAKKYGLQFVYGVEAYFVRDRKQDDATNAHIILLAQNYSGILQLNRTLSQANKDGFYKVPRVDMELLRTLDPNDVFVTTACVAFWGRVSKESQRVQWNYTDPEGDNSPEPMIELFLRLKEHFGASLMLEVQCHDTIWQKEVNELVLKLHYRYGVPIIAGLDSHYIYPQQKEERKWLREESGVHMNDEDHELSDSVYEDYPDEETVIERFRRQGVLTEDEIAQAVANTDFLLMFDEIELDTSRKLPTIYPKLTQQEKNERYLDLVQKAWNEYRQRIPQDQWTIYEESFHKDEVDIVLETGTADYFLLDHALVKRGKELGGHITPTGRGSCGSWFSNTLLGLSTLDRLSLPVPMYPSRFCTAARLKTSIPDIDLNLDDPSIFAKAQAELLGENHSCPMIAYGTLKAKSAFKLYARARNLPVDEANTVSRQIDAYELAMKEADDDERDTIDIADFVDEKYLHYITASEKYRGIVVSKSQAPCAYMVYNGDIDADVGILRVNADGGKKIVYCTVADGYTAEEFGYVKNDLLKVRVIGINAEAMRRANLPQYTSGEMIALTQNDPATWNIFANGWTQGINQCQGTGTTEKVMLYKPRALKDLSAFVAAIRPGFKSMVGMFLNREKFEYDIPVFDAMLKNDTTGSSWLLYQEDIMKCLSCAGFAMEDTYPIIKAISKKKVKVIEEAKEKFMVGFAAYLRQHGADDAQESAEKVWQIIIDSSAYSFNSAHSVAVALDALYGAYLKAHYPLAYYSTLLDNYSAKGDKDKLRLIKAEMKKAFGIQVAPCRFRQDNRSFSVIDEHNLADTLHSVKGIGAGAAVALYEMRDERFDSFADVLLRIDYERAINRTVVYKLIMLGYFEEFGKRSTLLAVYREFYDGKNKISKTLKDASRAKRMDALRAFEKAFDGDEIDPETQIAFEIENIGVPVSVFPDKKRMYAVLELDTKYSPKVKLYSLSTGAVGTAKILKKDYLREPFEVGDMLCVTHYQQKPAYSFVGGEKKRKDGVLELWIDLYIVTHGKKEAV